MPGFQKVRVKSESKSLVCLAKIRDTQQIPLMISSHRDSTPSLRIIWFLASYFKISTSKITAVASDKHYGDKMMLRLQNKCHALFQKNKWNKRTNLRELLKQEIQPIQEKTKPVLVHLEEAILSGTQSYNTRDT